MGKEGMFEQRVYIGDGVAEQPINKDDSVQNSDVSIIEDKLGNALNLYGKQLLFKAFSAFKSSTCAEEHGGSGPEDKVRSLQAISFRMI